METHSPNQGHVWLRLYNLPDFWVSSQAELPPRRFKVLCKNRHLLIIDLHLKQPPDEKSRHISQGIKLLTSTTDWLNLEKASTCWNSYNTCTLFPLALVAKHYVYGVHFKCQGVGVFRLTSGEAAAYLDRRSISCDITVFISTVGCIHQLVENKWLHFTQQKEEPY